MLRPFALAASLGAAAALDSQPAAAHFQLVYTPEVNVTRAADLPVRLIFWHPFDNGRAMDMDWPEEFYVVHRGAKTDLRDRLSPFRFHGPENDARAFAATLPVKRSGDYVMVAVPAPYYEGSEDVYIQQITKSMVNRNGIPTDWNREIGLKAEILPLTRPTNVLAGSTFSGQVLTAGEPAASAEIEIEYLAAEPDIGSSGAKAPTTAPAPGGMLMVIADRNGVFTFGVPKAGFWGFAALGVGPDTTFKNKELSQDAVLWIRAYDLMPVRSGG